tara:strand:- start:1684 stop:2340 length:657 start_codon:yes stop_codon:yes gene_type:complete
MAFTLNGTSGIAGIDGSAGGPSIKGTDGNSGIFYASNTVLFSTDGSERARFDSNGHLLIGTTSSSAPNGNAGVLIRKDANGSFIQISKLTTSPVPALEFYNANGRVGQVIPGGSSTNFSTTSDYRLKENAVGISDGITRLKTLKPYRFNFKADPNTTVDGFFAHEVTAVPESVTGEKDGAEMQGIDQSKLVPLLTAALQEAVLKIENLEGKVAALEAA